MGDRWYVLRVHPGQHRVAQLHLGQQHFVVFAPTVEKIVFIRGVAHITAMPLLASYIFIQFDKSRQRWWAINGTRGVVRLLPQHCPEPIPIPPGHVEELQKRVETGEFRVKYSRGGDEIVELGYKPGEIVPITGGLMFGQVGTFVRQLENLVELNVALLGRPVLVTLPTQLVTAPER